MALRHTTPPSYQAGMWYPGSVESHYGPPLYGSSTNNSPDSAHTADTSPQRSSPGTSAATIRSSGPTLLPKIRCQDQPREPTTSALHGNAHMRQPAAKALPMQLGVPNIHTGFSYAHQFKRRATGSPEARAVGIVDSPMSACSLPNSYFSGSVVNTPLTEVTASSSLRPSPLGGEFISPASHLTSLDSSSIISGSRRSSLAHVRSVSGNLPSPAETHSRNVSTGSTVVDENALLKHGYPTQYRAMPQYITATPSPVATPTLTITPTLPVQPLPQSMHAHHQSEQQQAYDFLVQTENLVSPQVGSPHEQIMLPSQPHSSGQVMSLMNYLTAPGARPNLITRSVTNVQALRDFGWWDVRNLRSWSDFSIDTLLSIPSLPDLLHFPLDQSSLPHLPNAHNAAVRGHPENEFNLRDMFFDSYGKRVNAALQVAQGAARHMALRVVPSATNQHCPKPDFIATYAHDAYIRCTPRGEMRGHIVGIVKSYDEWNTGMRSEDPPSQVKYLRGLAHLHRIMRDHGCRYGFIVTEIEILCVRAGADQHAPPHPAYRTNAYGSDEGPKPIFGWLETSKPVPLSTPAVNAETGAYNMTAALALWALCMMARDEPLPGQVGWQMDVGGPAALSRHNFRPRDNWMPKIGVHESRVAKRIRGWVMPEEPFSRKEAPGGRRGRK
jgi:hypothetical protein